jgi:hypothetical protein
MYVYIYSTLNEKSLPVTMCTQAQLRIGHHTI